MADLAAALDDGRLAVDVAIIATTGNHVADALALLRVGVRLLVEKPLAYSFADLNRLSLGFTELDRNPDEWLRIGYMKEYDPAVVEARALLPTVVPREVSIEVLHPADGRQLAFARLEPVATDVDRAALGRLDDGFQRSISTAVGHPDTTMRKLYSDVLTGSIIHDIALTRTLGLELAQVTHARRWGADFPGSVIAAGATADNVPWSIRWHYIPNYPEYRELVTIHHERGTVELEFGTPYVLNAPTILRIRSGGDDLLSTRSEQVWPQSEAFEQEFMALIEMSHGKLPAGSSLDVAHRDPSTAQALWKACATSDGMTISPACEAANPSHRMTLAMPGARNTVRKERR